VICHANSESTCMSVGASASSLFSDFDSLILRASPLLAGAKSKRIKLIALIRAPPSSPSRIHGHPSILQDGLVRLSYFLSSCRRFVFLDFTSTFD
jgi:hypothetical protein